MMCWGQGDVLNLYRSKKIRIYEIWWYVLLNLCKLKLGNRLLQRHLLSSPTASWNIETFIDGTDSYLPTWRNFDSNNENQSIIYFPTDQKLGGENLRYEDSQI